MRGTGAVAGRLLAFQPGPLVQGVPVRLERREGRDPGGLSPGRFLVRVALGALGARSVDGWSAVGVSLSPGRGHCAMDDIWGQFDQLSTLMTGGFWNFRRTYRDWFFHLPDMSVVPGGAGDPEGARPAHGGVGDPRPLQAGVFGPGGGCNRCSPGAGGGGGAAVTG